jgi:hypothetical protein
VDARQYKAIMRPSPVARPRARRASRAARPCRGRRSRPRRTAPTPWDRCTFSV